MCSGGKVWRIHCYSSLHSQPSNVSMISLTCYAEVDLREPQHLLNRVTVGTGGGQRPCFWYWQNLVYAREGRPVGSKQPRTILIVRPGQSPVPLPHTTSAPSLRLSCWGFVFISFFFLNLQIGEWAKLWPFLEAFVRSTEMLFLWGHHGSEHVLWHFFRAPTALEVLGRDVLCWHFLHADNTIGYLELHWVTNNTEIRRRCCL